MTCIDVLHAGALLAGLCCPEFANQFLSAVPYDELNVKPEDYLNQ